MSFLSSRFQVWGLILTMFHMCSCVADYPHYSFLPDGASDKEKTIRECLACGDAALSIAGDVVLSQENDGNQSIAGACKILGSLCNMGSNMYNPCMPKDVRALRMVSDGVRTLSYLPMLRGDAQDEGDVQAVEGKRSENFLLSTILRLVSVGADWFAVQKEHLHGRDMVENCFFDDDTRKKWALARLISSWSRAFADGLTAPVLGKTASYFSAVVDSYELLKTLNPEWAENVRKANEQQPTPQPVNISPQQVAAPQPEPQQRFNEDDRRSRFRAMRPNDSIASMLNEECCPVCLDEDKQLLRRNFGMYPCGHIFCRDCMSKIKPGQRTWEDEYTDDVYTNKCACPICRQPAQERDIIT